MRRVAIIVLAAAALVSGCAGSHGGDAHRPPASLWSTWGELGLRMTTTGAVTADATPFTAVIRVPAAQGGAALAGTITVTSTRSTREQVLLEPGYFGDRRLARLARLVWLHEGSTWECGHPAAPCRVTQLAPTILLLKPGESTPFHVALHIPVNPTVTGRHLDVVVRFTSSR